MAAKARRLLLGACDLYAAEQARFERALADVDIDSDQAAAPGERSSGEGGSMSPLMMGSRQVKGITAEEGWRRGRVLVAALGTGGEQLDPVQTRAGADVVDKVQARTALRGGTPSWPWRGPPARASPASSTALVGADVATVGANRPRARPTAAVWGRTPSEAPGLALRRPAPPRQRR